MEINQIYLLHLQLQTFILFTYGEMWLLNKISCEIQILNEKVGKLMIENGKLEKENKKLKERVSELEDVSKDYDTLSKDFITATGEIEFRKDEVERFKQNAMQDMKEITDLEIENRKLKSDLEECQCSFGFESDEVGFWKGEYKRLKKWIKDHCKGYGNLFPEDEMKRQWKKADKKRK